MSRSCAIRYGNTKIDYELLMMNRKSLEIAVHPDASVIVKAPLSSTIEAVEQRVRKRARWIKKQITYFNQFEPRTPSRKYVGGESHLYLGRKYRLKIEKISPELPISTGKVVLKNGYFFMHCVDDSPACLKSMMDAWYYQRGKIILPKVFDGCWGGFKKGEIEKPTLTLKKMTKRWGSLSTKGRLMLNLDLIQTPKECIEYVVIHELCHLLHHHHGAEFYNLLERTLPDWKKYKHKLEMSLA